MSIEACVYILLAHSITSGLEDLKKNKHAHGDFSEEQKKKDVKEMMAVEMTKWNSKVTKIASVVNPDFGDFLGACETLWNYVEQQRRDDNPKGSKKDKLGYISCGLDRARLFTGVTSLSNKMRIRLLEAQVKPELRKQFYHPPGFSENETKNWLHQWSVWDQNSHLCKSLLSAMLEEILPLHPDEKISLDSSGEPRKALEDSIFLEFESYEKKVINRFFEKKGVPENVGQKMWDRAEVVVARRRAKRMVYRFFVDMEACNDLNYWWILPLLPGDVGSASHGGSPRYLPSI